MGHKEAIRFSKEQLQGEAYQCIFQSEAYKRGLLVEKSDVPLPWDFTVTNPDNIKKPFRVQVKGTGVLVKKTATEAGRYSITAKAGNKKGAIDPDIIDVCSFYVEQTQTWYNMPVTALGGSRSVWLYPHIKNSKGSYESWRYDWSIFYT